MLPWHLSRFILSLCRSLCRSLLPMQGLLWDERRPRHLIRPLLSLCRSLLTLCMSPLTLNRLHLHGDRPGPWERSCAWTWGPAWQAHQEGNWCVCVCVYVCLCVCLCKLCVCSHTHTHTHTHTQTHTNTHSHSHSHTHTGMHALRMGSEIGLHTVCVLYRMCSL